MRKFIIALVILALSMPVFGVVTLYNSYNRKTAPWTIQADPQFLTLFYAFSDGVAAEHPWNGSEPGWDVVIPATYPAGNVLFDTALDVDTNAEAYIVFYTADTSARAINNTFNPTEGTVEMWIAPNWSGVNQGGTGPGLAAGEFSTLMVTGATELSGPLSVCLFNNGPAYGGAQLFMSFKNDAIDYWIMNNSFEQPAPPPADTYGTVGDWVAGEWHHVAMSWDATKVGLYLDGGTVREETRTQPVNLDMMGNGGYLYCRNRGANYSPDEVINVWDGMVDDFTVSNHAKYTSTAGGPSLPTEPELYPGDLIYRAWNPSPANPSSVYRADGATLSWNAGTGAVTHKVYWSDVEAEVTGRTVTVKGGVKLRRVAV